MQYSALLRLSSSLTLKEKIKRVSLCGGGSACVGGGGCEWVDVSSSVCAEELTCSLLWWICIFSFD